jgi:hypothetical protein
MYTKKERGHQMEVVARLDNSPLYSFFSGSNVLEIPKMQPWKHMYDFRTSKELWNVRKDRNGAAYPAVETSKWVSKEPYYTVVDLPIVPNSPGRRTHACKNIDMRVGSGPGIFYLLTEISLSDSSKAKIQKP